jgi:two-component system, NarL family, sensor kinase
VLTPLRCFEPRRSGNGTLVLRPVRKGLRKGRLRVVLRSTDDRGAVAAFALGGLGVVVALAVVGVAITRHVGSGEAVRGAKVEAGLAGRGIVQPALRPGLLRGEAAAIDRVDRVVRAGVLRDGIVRVKIWSPGGRILYSDEPRLIGQRYRLGEDDADALRRGGVEAEISDLNRPENRFERRWSKLLEVYLPITMPNTGERLLFETYTRYSSISASEHRLWLAFLPWILGALLLLWLVQVPLAARLVRRLAQGQRDREALLRRALDASDLERRRIARDLHDGVVQDLAGVSYSLAATAESAESPEIAAALRDGAASTRQALRALRGLLVEIYPPDLHRTGLRAALSDLVAPLSARGLETRLDAPDLELPPEAEATLFRAAQEAIRNAASHSGATQLDVALAQTNGSVTLSVHDDGRGFDPAEQPEGHFGLRMMRDLLREAGGSLTVESSPGEGTTVRAEVPVG